jgi:hypothetical protein
MALGEAHYHLVGAGGDTTSAAAFARAADLDPDFVPPVIHLFEIAVARHDADGATMLAERVRATSPDSTYAGELDLLGRCLRDGPGAIDWAAEAERALLAVRQASRALAVAGSHPECAEGANRALLDVSGPSSSEGSGAVKVLSGLLVAQGRHADALAVVDSASEEQRTLGLLHLVNGMSGARMEGRDDAFAVWLPGYLESQFGPEYLMAPSASTLWTLGAWHGARGDAAEVQSIASAMERRIARDGDAISRMAFDALRGWEAFARSDTASAIRTWSDIEQRGSPADLAWDLAIPMGVERRFLAELLLARGEAQRAYDVAASLDHPQPVAFLVHLPASLDIRAEAATRMGRTGEAAELRARLARLSPSAVARDAARTHTPQ